MKQYKPLYLKYRPQKLSEVIGQEVVTKTLSNAITYNKIVHAYLFCGPRGTGKTSTARILAKSLNCQSGITLDPCEACVSCKSITEGNSLDVIEIDAASHRKVEDAEDLINRVSLGTYGSRFKIYIIDEVHMLTDHAFNALLKTLEEPPKNVIFILATTEEYKVIPTIISRCQKLEFKPVLPVELEKRIKEIALKESILIQENIVNFISGRSHGCLRDAISLLDQISVLQEGKTQIKSEQVFELFGTVDRVLLFKLAETILSFDVKNAIDLAEDLVKSGKDIIELFKNLLEVFIDLGKAKIDPNYRKSLGTEFANDLKFLEKIEISHILKIIDKLQDAQSKIRFALSQELQFMAEIMSILDTDFLISATDLMERVKRLETEETVPKSSLREAERRSNLTNADKLNIAQLPQDANETQTTSALPRIDSQDEPHKKEESTSDLDTLWKKIIQSIESNPTRTLLIQSKSYLLSLDENAAEVGLSKDMFLPRLEQDAKKKDMILRSIKSVSTFEPQVLRFRVVPRQIVNKDNISDGSSLQEQNDINHENVTGINEEKIVNMQGKHQKKSYEDDEFSRTIKDLLGAREID